MRILSERMDTLSKQHVKGRSSIGNRCGYCGDKIHKVEPCLSNREVYQSVKADKGNTTGEKITTDREKMSSQEKN